MIEEESRRTDGLYVPSTAIWNSYCVVVLSYRRSYLQWSLTKVHQQFGAGLPSWDFIKWIKIKLRQLYRCFHDGALKSTNHMQKRLSAQVWKIHPAHSSSKRQKLGQTSALAVSGAAAGLAEVDEAKAATTARAIEEETRIICELCDLGSDDFEDSRRTAGFYVLKYCYMKFVLGGCAFKQMRAWSAMPADCQPTIYWTNSRVQSAVIPLYQKHSTSWSHFRTPRWVCWVQDLSKQKPG